MTNNRKEPTFSSSPHHDDPPQPEKAPVSRQAPGQGSSRSTTRPAAAGPASSSGTVPATVSATKSSPLIPLALLLALTGLGLAGFTYWQLLKAQQQVSVAEKRLVLLESRLQLTEGEATQSVVTLQANLREAKDSLELAHEEIRKLWDTRNVNKKAIADTAAEVDGLAKTVKTASTAAAAAQKAAQEQLQNWKALSSEVSLQVEQLRVVSDLAQNQQKRIRELVDAGNKLDSQFAALKNDLAGRVKSNEEAIQSIDNYRRIVNRDLLQIKEQLSSKP